MTPMMRQYLDIKERNADCILFFRLGDFYEMFGEDARIASKELDLVLTTRDRTTEDPDERVPMCGVPYHAAETYIARLIAKGYRVAICEQMEDPATAKGLVDRDIIRIVTPGTLMESSMLDESKPNYLCAVYADDPPALCFADLSTGEISITELPSGDYSRIENELSSFSPAEAVLCGNQDVYARVREFLVARIGCPVQCRGDLFTEEAAESLRIHFGVDACESLTRSALLAAGALLAYISETQKTDISHLHTLRRNAGGAFMELDINAMRNLELTCSLRTGDKKGSLLWVLDKTRTPMGRRLLRAWVLRPLLQTAQITKRQNAVSELVYAMVARSELMVLLRGVGDLERMIAKIVYGNAGCRDLVALSSSIRVLPLLSSGLGSMRSSALRSCADMDLLADVAERIDCAIRDDPPFSVREVGFIRDGFVC